MAVSVGAEMVFGGKEGGRLTVSLFLILYLFSFFPLGGVETLRFLFLLLFLFLFPLPFSSSFFLSFLFSLEGLRPRARPAYPFSPLRALLLHLLESTELKWILVERWVFG